MKDDRDGKLIALNAKRRRGFNSTIPERDQERGLIVQWPRHQAAEEPTVGPGRSGRRRRRSPGFRRWLPTVAVTGIVAGMVLLVAAIRMLGEPFTTGTLPPTVTAPADAPAIEPPLVAVMPESAIPEPVAGSGLRLTIRRIEPSYTVASGDSLFAIALRYNTTVEGLLSINNLSSSTLSVGQRLIIP